MLKKNELASVKLEQSLTPFKFVMNLFKFIFYFYSGQRINGRCILHNPYLSLMCNT